jgi:hypothetical protein
VVNDDGVPPIKLRMEQEERRIKELQDRMEELAKKVNTILQLVLILILQPS